MRKFLLPSLLFLLSIPMAFWSCIEPKDSEMEKPSLALIHPNPCDTLFQGDSCLFQMELKDNTGLGYLSMDIHHNFGHHDHGAHESCALDPVKEPLNPFLDNWIFELPETETEFLFETWLFFPETDGGQTSYDQGDYHFHIYVTDNEGYQLFTTMDVKLLNR
jgi:hypothetical protein